MTFAHREEAAAFVAALSGFLASPAGTAYATRHAADERLEVWAHRSTDDHDVELYLSDAALGATAAGFATPTGVVTVRGAELPPDSVCMLEGSRATAVGLDEASRLIP